MSVRAKMKCVEITETDYCRRVKLGAVYGSPDRPDNASWSKATPSGSIELSITNPDAYEQFKVGAEFFVDFTPAPAPPK